MQRLKHNAKKLHKHHRIKGGGIHKTKPHNIEIIKHQLKNLAISTTKRKKKISI